MSGWIKSKRSKTFVASPEFLKGRESLVTLECRFDVQVRSVSLSGGSFHADDEVTAAIVSRPKWMPFEWPEDASIVYTDDDLRVLALLKMMTIFEFASSAAGYSDGELYEHVLKENPKFAQNGASMPSERSDWNLFVATASIARDGFFSGGYSQIEKNKPIPLANPSQEWTDQFVKAMTRIAIRSEIKRIRSKWNPF